VEHARDCEDPKIWQQKTAPKLIVKKRKKLLRDIDPPQKKVRNVGHLFPGRARGACFNPWLIWVGLNISENWKRALTAKTGCIIIKPLARKPNHPRGALKCLQAKEINKEITKRVPISTSVRLGPLIRTNQD
jgi:hypothetical protein